MKENIIQAIVAGMQRDLDCLQIARLKAVLHKKLQDVEVTETSNCQEQNEKRNAELLESFLSAKKIEGCSEKTLAYYKHTIERMLKTTAVAVCHVSTSIDLLASTGIRVGELVKLDHADIDFHERQCIVFGKGNKERLVYFNASTKLHLQQYLESRSDDDPALFVSLPSPHSRLTISGVEVRIRDIGKRLGMQKVHPHKFRRTLATMAIDKGMPIEQVQRLLGHVRIDTTLQYAIVNQNNVKMVHKKYLC